ncbi:MAG: DUF4349 domain-containing protein [Eubacteriaceae bacterium]|nr:DUF4349 domain-containing protein [Eubacteriaceae bacterium]
MKNKNQFICLLAAILMLAASCSAGGSAGSVKKEESYGASPYYASEDAADDIMEEMESNGIREYSSMLNPQETQIDAGGGLPENNTDPEGHKVIRNASLQIKADDASGFYKSVIKHCNELGGYEFSYSISIYDTYTAINATVKVPPAKLSAFVSFVGDNAELTNSSMDSRDITEDYFDANTRLETKRKALEQYYTLLQKAENVEEIVYVQKIIDDITESIESLEGRIRLWDSLTSMSTVSLYIRQENGPVQARKEISWNTLSFSDMGYLIRHSFLSIANTVTSLIQWMIIALIGYSPIWAILAATVLLLRWVRKNKGVKTSVDINADSGNINSES